MEKQKKQTWLKGLLGAILGGLGALIGWAAVAYFVGGNLHLCFGFIMALLVYMGYLGLGGSRGRAFYIIYPLVVLVLGAAAFLLGSALAAVHSMGSEMLGNYAMALHGGSRIAALFDLTGQWLPVVWESLRLLWKDAAIAAVFALAGGAYFVMKLRDERAAERAAKETAAEADEAAEEPNEETGEAAEETENAAAEGEEAEEPAREPAEEEKEAPEETAEKDAQAEGEAAPEPPAPEDGAAEK